MMNVFIALLVVGSVTQSLESCLGDNFVWTRGCITTPTSTHSVLLNRSDSGGCECREIPKVLTVCYKIPTCKSVPKNLTVRTNAFSFKSSQILEIKPGDFTKMVHLEVLSIEANNNLTRVKRGSFLNMTNLKNLSISLNANLKVLEAGCFDGLLNLQRLYLHNNAFVELSEVISVLNNLPKLMVLELNENTFHKITNKDFQVLGNSNLKELSLNLCQIKEIESKAFNPLKNLTVLRLDENDFNLTTFARVVQETVNKVPLEELNLRFMGLRENTSKELLSAIAKTNISVLNLGKNLFEVINSETFPRMPNLEDLNLKEMQLLSITNDAFVGLPKLKTLRLSPNKLASPPEGMLLEQLSHLDLQENSGDTSYFTIYGKKFVKMKKLEHLDLSSNTLLSIYNTSFEGLQNLKTLVLKNATIYLIQNGTFAMLSNLIYLNLEDNPFMKNYPLTLEQGLFNGLTNLRTLLLGGCGIISIGKEANPFKDLKKLQHLALDRNNLLTLPNFEVLVNLRRINLPQNGFQPWLEPIFSKNQHLEEVFVCDNKFAYLSKAMIQDFKNLKKLNLENNPFTCDCSFSWNDKQIMSLITDQKIYCTFSEATTSLTVQEFLRKGQHCENLTLIVPLTVLGFCLGLTLFSLYYFRWHIRYWIFLTRLHLSRNQKIRRSEAGGYTNYNYDAFVSYSNEDRNFVIKLVTMLENHPPFIKLCVYERDFEVGTMISENVLESVAKSRKTLLIISKSYAKSQWCCWESQIAEHHRLFFQTENGEYVDDSLILIKLGSVNETQMMPTLKFLLKTRIYLQWDVDEKKQKVFWEKLRDLLKPPTEINENTYF